MEIELDDGSAFRLGADSQGELSDYTRLSTGQRVTLVSLDHGVAWATGHPQGKDALTLAAPGMQVIFTRGARIRLEAGPTTRLSVLEGSVRFSSPTAEIDLVQGQYTRVDPEKPARFVLDRGITEMELDRWSAERDQALTPAAAALHVVERYGLADLDAAGQWIDTDVYGPVWQPKAPQGWAPFQNGRWRWYDALGYTWVSGDSWGWLPYHYGRWARTGELGWVWAPSVSQVFKPGEVYWMRAAKMAGWGPLAPGEKWQPPALPLQFLNAHTTWAAFAPEAAVVDPAGFTDSPKEPLAVAAFVSSLPSPAFSAARLDALRPVVMAGSTRIVPSLRGVSFQDFGDEPAAEPARTIVITPAAPPPVVIVTPPAPEPDQTAAAYAVPYPVLAGTLSMNVVGTTGKSAPAKAGTSPAAPAAASTTAAGGRSGSRAGSRPLAPGARPKRPRDEGEVEAYNRVMRDAVEPAKQLADLEAWSHRYPASDYEDDRTVMYMQVYSKLNHPNHVVEQAQRLMEKGVPQLFTDPAYGPTQILNVYYLTTVSGQLLPNPGKAEARTITEAAAALRDYTSVFFDPVRKPANLSDADWAQARSFMENTAKRTLTLAERWRRTN